VNVGSSRTSHLKSKRLMCMITMGQKGITSQAGLRVPKEYLRITGFTARRAEKAPRLKDSR
jgi:hypothetical protein